MQKKNYQYFHDKQSLNGYLCYEENENPKPAVLVAHDWSGQNHFAKTKAELLANLGYIGFAVDMYGEGRVGQTTDEKKELMNPLISDRLFLRERITQALETVMELPFVDKNKIALIGFCFGGLCVLDLARSGAKISGVVSFHGLLSKPDNIANKKIHSKILVLHGYDDPMATPEDLNNFCKEMTEAQVDWQVHAYGNTQHAFTNPEAHDLQLGTVYNGLAEKRSFQAMKNFLTEIFS